MIVGGGRYVVVEPGKAEVAFAVIDEYQGQGIGAALCAISPPSPAAPASELIAEVLPENVPMLNVFEKSGFGFSTKHGPGVVHVTLRLV